MTLNRRSQHFRPNVTAHDLQAARSGAVLTGGRSYGQRCLGRLGRQGRHAVEVISASTGNADGHDQDSDRRKPRNSAMRR